MLVEEDRTRIPHTNKQLARGFLGLAMGGTTAILLGLSAHLLRAPLAIELTLGVFAALALVFAILMPVWYWFVQPFRG